MANTSNSTSKTPPVKSSAKRIAELRGLIQRTEGEIASGNAQKGIFDVLSRYYSELSALENKSDTDLQSVVVVGSRNNSTNAKADRKAKRLSGNGSVNVRFKKDVERLNRAASKASTADPLKVNLANNIGG